MDENSESLSEHFLAAFLVALFLAMINSHLQVLNQAFLMFAHNPEI